VQMRNGTSCATAVTSDRHAARLAFQSADSLPTVLAFPAAASRPTAVLTGPAVIAGPPPGVTRLTRPATGDMVRICIAGYPLTATAALVWNGDLPRPLQQLLFDTADGTAPPPASTPPAAAQPGQQRAAEPISGGTPALAGPE
jgi:hypothetical protein